MNKTNVLKNLLAGIIIVLVCVILTIPTILKMNSEITEYKNKVQSLEQEIIQLKKSTHNEENNKSSINNVAKQNNTVEGKNIDNNDEDKKDTTENTVSDTATKTDTSTYQQNNNVNNVTTNNTTITQNATRNTYSQSYSSNTQSYSSNTNSISTSGYYILNKSTKKFHIPTCRSVKQMNDSNKIEFHGTRNEAISNGYSPCGICHP